MRRPLTSSLYRLSAEIHPAALFGLDSRETSRRKRTNVQGRQRPEGYQIQRAGSRLGSALFRAGSGLTGSIGEERPGFETPAAFRPRAREPPVRAEDLRNSRLFMGTFLELPKG
jgi:hypothetical protein